MMLPSTVTISHDGDFTRVIGQNGEDLSVSSVKFEHTVNEEPVATVGLLQVPVEAECGRVDYKMLDPVTGEQKVISRILFKDGSEWAAESERF